MWNFRQNIKVYNNVFACASFQVQNADTTSSGGIPSMEKLRLFRSKKKRKKKGFGKQNDQVAKHPSYKSLISLN